jgi:hypothetical protein
MEKEGYIIEGEQFSFIPRLGMNTIKYILGEKGIKMYYDWLYSGKEI